MSEQDDVFETAYRHSRAYMRDIPERAVMPSEEALQKLPQLREPLPFEGEPAAQVIDRLHELGSPNTVASTGGRFFGFVVGGALPVAVAASWLASSWDQNAGTWVLSPIAGDLETVSGEWMLELFGLPRDAVFGFVTGATMATFSSIAAARSALLRRRGFDVKRSGLAGVPPIRLIMSEEIHPTNKAALGYAGFGTDQIEYVPVDDQGRMIPEKMPPLDDLSLVMLQSGNINSGASDDFQTICELAKEAGAWTHVDAAFGLWARVSEHKKHLVEGIELADSWSVDGHKWLNLPQDSAVYFCRDGEAIHDAFGVDATYLIRDGNRQGNNFTPELSRRARGVEFWAALKSLGRNGIANIVDETCRHARVFADGIAQSGLEVLNDVVLNQVVFRAGSAEQTKQVLERIQNSGVLWLGPTTWRGAYALRISVSSAATNDADVQRSLEAIRSAVVQVTRQTSLQTETKEGHAQ